MATTIAAERPALHRPSKHASGMLESLATIVHCRTGETLYYPRDAAEYCYQLITGAACECALMPDGRRQIVDFLLPGDLFGLGTHRSHDFGVEIIAAATTLARYPRQRVAALAETDPLVAGELLDKALQSIARLQARTVVLGRTSVLEKVSAFLLVMADRLAGGTNGDLVLPMSRHDIADYLAMAVETVSRALTALRQRHVIALHGTRQVRIIDRDALKDCGRPAAASQRRYPHTHGHGDTPQAALSP